MLGYSPLYMERPCTQSVSESLILTALWSLIRFSWRLIGLCFLGIRCILWSIPDRVD